MITQEQIDRINVLAKKAKSEGLTEKEKKEQKKLRDEYVQVIKARVKEHADRIKFVEDLSEEEVEKHKAEKN